MFTNIELRTLRAYAKKKGLKPPALLGDAVLLVAAIGGYLGRKNDPPPGHPIAMAGLYRFSAYECRVLSDRRWVILSCGGLWVKGRPRSPDLCNGKRSFLVKQGPATKTISFNLIKEINLSKTPTSPEELLQASFTLIGEEQPKVYKLLTNIEGKTPLLCGRDEAGLSVMIPLSACVKLKFSEATDDLDRRESNRSRS